jgi:two-component system sensor histidine kinase UhpB
MSLRLRLVALVMLLAALTAAAGFGFTVAGARARVRDETRSALELATVAVAAAAPAGETLPQAEQLSRRLAGLPLRHVAIHVEPAGAAAPAPPPAVSGGAPGWFGRLLGATRLERRIPVAGGTLVLTAAPGDEVAEVWADMTELLAVAAIGLAVLLAAVHAAVTRALRPLASFSAALGRLERGEVEVAPAAAAVPELAALGTRISALAASLKQARAENAALSAALVAAEDRERADLARDIHDELGPLVFAIRVDAHALSQAAAGAALEPEAVTAQAGAITAAAAQIRDLSRRILGRLRPMALDHMPLADVLADLAGELRRRRPGLALQLDLPAGGLSGLGESVGVTLYRVVREAALNALTHAEAARLDIRIHRDPAEVPPRLAVEIADDGRGGAAAERGYGIATMRERLRALGGDLHLAPGPDGRGTRVHFTIPLP